MLENEKSSTKWYSMAIDDIKSKKIRIAVLGLGYVGLPTAALFAKAGFTVTAIDIRTDIVNSVNNGLSPINEPGLQNLISTNRRSGRLEARMISHDILATQDVFLITVQTPIDSRNEPNLLFLLNAINAIGKALTFGNVVIVCSTVPPNTLNKEIKPALEVLSGLKADADFFLAYVPERIAPGKALDEFVSGSRLVGGIGPNSTEVGLTLFREVCKNVIGTDAIIAEIAKTAENTFRDVNIAFANELALICEQHGADAIKVIELANTHPRVNIHNFGPGVGGPCLTKDPCLLIHKADLPKMNLITVARHTNNAMPDHVILLLLDALQAANKLIADCQITIFGTAYKADVDDPRFSPSGPIIKRIKDSDALVIAYDPFCPESFGAIKARNLEESLKDSDCLIVLTDHSEFKNMDMVKIKHLMRGNPIIVDAKRIIEPVSAQNAGFIYRAIGYKKS